MRTTLSRDKGGWPGFADGGFPPRRRNRFKTRLSRLDSKHSFSFSRHYDPLNAYHGLLLVNNDDVVRPGTGFETHSHQDMEMVTWALQGSLVHQDSTGHAGIIYPGLAQRMSVGTGILHSEKNGSRRLRGGSEHTDLVHFAWFIFAAVGRAGRASALMSVSGE
jgi:redox-sensitive bicupin YhaK (pirin superfamily)